MSFSIPMNSQTFIKNFLVNEGMVFVKTGLAKVPHSG